MQLGSPPNGADLAGALTAARFRPRPSHRFSRSDTHATKGTNPRRMWIGSVNVGREVLESTARRLAAPSPNVSRLLAAPSIELVKFRCREGQDGNHVARAAIQHHALTGPQYVVHARPARRTCTLVRRNPHLVLPSTGSGVWTSNRNTPAVDSRTSFRTRRAVRPGR